jgi:hypothetical protein
MLSEIAAMFEKETHKQYLIAILLHEILLLTPFAEHRRGKWYKRLCIDYEHLKRTAEACAICERGLQDGNLLVSILLQPKTCRSNFSFYKHCFFKQNCLQLSDEIDLQDRWQVLRKRLANQTAVSLRKSISSSAKSQKRALTVPESNNVDLTMEPVVDTVSNIAADMDVFSMLAWAVTTHSVSNQLSTMFLLLLEQLHPLLPLHVTSKFGSDATLASEAKPSTVSFPPKEEQSKSAISVTPKSANLSKSNNTISSTASLPKLSPKATWICHVCTFLNTKKALLSKFSKHRCAMCDTVHLEEREEEQQPLKTTSSPPVTALVKSAQTLPVASNNIIDLLDSSDDDCGYPEEVRLVESKAQQQSMSLKTCPLVQQTKEVDVTWQYQLALTALKTTQQQNKQLHQIPRTDIHSHTEKNMNRKKDDDLLTACCKATFPLGDPDMITSSICLQAFTIQGRRFGDPKRKGKNKFCGIHDELLFVEELVMQKCRIFDHDECESELFDNGLLTNQKHVDEDEEDIKEEVVKTSKTEKDATDVAQLKAFQAVHYQEVIDEASGWQGWHCEGGILRTLFGVMMWDVLYADLPHVFFTAYQDLPLDFPYPSFFLNR